MRRVIGIVVGAATLTLVMLAAGCGSPSPAPADPAPVSSLATSAVPWPYESAGLSGEPIRTRFILGGDELVLGYWAGGQKLLVAWYDQRNGRSRTDNRDLYSWQAGAPGTAALLSIEQEALPDAQVLEFGVATPAVAAVAVEQGGTHTDLHVVKLGPVTAFWSIRTGPVTDADTPDPRRPVFIAAGPGGTVLQSQPLKQEPAQPLG